jgi:anti-sigma factor RsiW
MACPVYEKQLALLEDYLGGRLSPAEAEEVRAHASGCEPCRRELENARLAGALLRGTLEPAAAASGAFWTRLRATLRTAEEQRASFWGSLETWAWRWSLSAALVAAMMAGYFIGSRYPVARTPGDNGLEAREIFPEPEPTGNDDAVLLLARGGERR